MREPNALYVRDEARSIEGCVNLLLKNEPAIDRKQVMEVAIGNAKNCLAELEFWYGLKFGAEDREQFAKAVAS